jgi:DeoR/GlpR family transcriptional regulator of sugar metabolism
METVRGQRMIRSEREFAILELIEREGVVSVRALAERWPAIAGVTFRRDLARLEAAGRLRRTHGGAVRLGAQPARGSAAEPGGSAAEQADALILPPIGGRWAHTLREHARRRGIPLIAESSPQEGGTYVGPDNRRAGRELGRLAARTVARRGEDSAEILLLSLEELPNTRDRTRGFAEGFREAFAGTVRTHLIDGRGAFGRAYRSALDALQAFPSIDVLFGVNDHSIMAAIEACRRLGRPEGSYAAFSVGGEGGTLLEELARDGPLQACAALFPEVVGRLAIDTACRRISDAQCPARVETRFDLLTPRNLGDYYAKVGEQWRLRAEVRERMAGGLGVTLAPERAIAGKRISFVPHYPAHEWYRNLAAAMAERAAELGVVFAARNAADRHALEVTELRRVIAGAAAATVGDGETILLDGGPVSRLVAGRLAGRRGLTVVTNSLEVLDALGGSGGGPRVVLTGGEVVGRGLLLGPVTAATLEGLRADKAFLSVDGLSAGFGASSDDERVADACRRSAAAARETVVLADHSLIGLEARFRICALRDVHTVMTDRGTLPAYRLELAALGPRVVLVDEEEPPRTAAA